MPDLTAGNLSVKSGLLFCLLFVYTWLNSRSRKVNGKIWLK